MRQDIRRLIGAALLGVAAASFGTLFWLTFRIIGSRPTHPVPALGLIVPFNDKGTNYFVTHTESAAVHLSFWSSWWLGLLAVVILNWEVIVPPPGTPRWANHDDARWKPGLETFSWRHAIAAAAGALARGTAGLLYGAPIARTALRLGLVHG